MKSAFFYFTILKLSRSVQGADWSKNELTLNCKASGQFQKDKQNIFGHCCSGSPKAELFHFPLLFCRGWLRNVQRFIMHIHSHCAVQLTFSLMMFMLPLL